MDISIAARFNGPDGSANGGYVCGLVAAAAARDSYEVSLKAPPPLERPLRVEISDGGEATVTDGETAVAIGRPANIDGATGPLVSLEEAAAAEKAGYERWSGVHPFPRCFVCGPDRTEGDGLRIFPGSLDGGHEFGCTWTPGADLAGADGNVRPEFVWAALDCPTSAPVAGFDEGRAPIVLARLVASLKGSVRTGEPHVVTSWPIAVEGRKRHSAAVLTDGDGNVLARALALWIALRER